MTPLRIGIDARAAAEVPQAAAAMSASFSARSRSVTTRTDTSSTRAGAGTSLLDERFSWRERELPESVWHLHAAHAANANATYSSRPTAT